jgi:hypothetical protein
MGQLKTTHKLYAAREVFKKFIAQLNAGGLVIDQVDNGEFPGADEMEITYTMCEIYKVAIKEELMRQYELLQPPPPPPPTEEEPAQPVE